MIKQIAGFCLVSLLFILTTAGTSNAGAHPATAGQVQAQQDTTKKKPTIKLFLDKIEVQGWIDRPQMVYVVPGVNPEVDDIVLDRSFLDEILRPLDKDTFEKQKLVHKRTIIPW